MKLYFNGKILAEQDARLSVLEETHWNGSALAETMRVKAGRVLNLRLHMRRLEEGARVLMMPELSKDVFQRAAKQLVRLNRLSQGALRCRYFRDGSLLMHPLPQAKRPSSQGISMVTTAVRHYGSDSMQGRVKGNSMLPNLLSRWESQAWAEDGLRLTRAGYVAEGVWSNIVIETRGILKTPPLSEGILEGTTREATLKRWRARKKPVQEVSLTRYDLYAADRVWVCSSRWGLVKVREVDGRVIGD